MRHKVCFLAFLTAGCVANSMQATNQSPRLDFYEDAIRRAVELEPENSRTFLRGLFAESLRLFTKAGAARQVRQEVVQIADVTNQVRLEVGNVNQGTYRVAWFLETSQGVSAFTNLFTHGTLTSLVIPERSWRSIVEALTRVSPEAISHCRSAVAVDDGSAYFVDAEINGSSRRFAVYGFIPSAIELPPESRQTSMKPCGDILNAIYLALPRSGA